MTLRLLGLVFVCVTCCVTYGQNRQNTWIAGLIDGSCDSTEFMYPIYNGTSSTLGARRLAASILLRPFELLIFSGAGYCPPSKDILNEVIDGFFNDMFALRRVSLREHQISYVGGPKGCNSRGEFDGGDASWPGSRTYGKMWKSSLDQSTVYLFGGYGYTQGGTAGCLSDLWKLNTDSLTWRYIGQPDQININPRSTFPSKNVFNSSGFPGGRFFFSVAHDDVDDFVYLYGGWGYSYPDHAETPDGGLGDLLKYDPENNVFIFVGGNMNLGVKAVYGDTFSFQNYPGAREGPMMWIVNSRIFVFGGCAYFETNGEITGYGVLGDLWEFFDAYGFKYVGGSKIFNDVPIRKQGDTFTLGNIKDAYVFQYQSDVYLFGGQDGGSNFWSFLWRFDIASLNFFYLFGGTDISEKYGNCVGSVKKCGWNPNNRIGGRFKVGGSFLGYSHQFPEFIVMGGEGFDSNGKKSYLADVWSIAYTPTCYGLSLRDFRVCSNGRGVCNGDTGKCECFEGFEGEQCQFPICYKYVNFSENACCGISHGICTSNNTCICKGVWQAKDCCHYQCHEIWEYDGNVCSGHGQCQIYDYGNGTSETYCECDLFHAGKLCTQFSTGIVVTVVIFLISLLVCCIALVVASVIIHFCQRLRRIRLFRDKYTEIDLLDSFDNADDSITVPLLKGTFPIKNTGFEVEVLEIKEEMADVYGRMVIRYRKNIFRDGPFYVLKQVVKKKLLQRDDSVLFKGKFKNWVMERGSLFNHKGEIFYHGNFYKGLPYGYCEKGPNYDKFFLGGRIAENKIPSVDLSQYIPDGKVFEIIEILGKGTFGYVLKLKTIDRFGRIKWVAMKFWERKEGNDLTKIRRNHDRWNAVRLYCNYMIEFFGFDNDVKVSIRRKLEKKRHSDPDVYVIDKMEGFACTMELGDCSIVDWVRMKERTNREKMEIILKIAEGIRIYQKQGFCHSDLKAGNIIFYRGEIRICDVDGFILKVDAENPKKTLKLFTGSLTNVAPEYVAWCATGFGKPPDPEKCEVYSFATLMYSVIFKCFGVPQYDLNVNDHEYNITEVLQVSQTIGSKNGDLENARLLCCMWHYGARPKIDDDKFERETPDDKWIIDLMKLCWKKKVDDRPGFDNIISTIKEHLEN